MSGELEKRIHADSFCYDIHDFGDSEVGEYHNQTEDVLKVVAEAKADFPKRTKLPNIQVSDNAEPIHDLWMYSSDEVYKWFKKWFGGQEGKGKEKNHK